MPGRTIIITGASDGIGAAAARKLSLGGDRVVIVGRSPSKTATVAAEVGADFFIADFADLEQVRGLAAELLQRYPRIDVLANNAGGIMGAREGTVDGHEKTFQVDHLAPFLLTTLLIDRLVASGASVIQTSGDAKLANILFTAELHRRYHDRGISTAAFHPGVVATSFSTSSTSIMRFVYKTPLKRLLLSPEQGSDTLVWLATSRPGTDWASGRYYEKRRITGANRQAYDPNLASGLWERSEAMVSAAAAREEPDPVVE